MLHQNSIVRTMNQKAKYISYSEIQMKNQKKYVTKIKKFGIKVKSLQIKIKSLTIFQMSSDNVAEKLNKMKMEDIEGINSMMINSTNIFSKIKT